MPNDELDASRRRRAYLSRWVCLDVESNLRRVGEEARAAAAGGAGLCVFPEIFLHGYTRRLDPAVARSRFAEISSAHPDVAFVFGSISEDRRNRMTVWRAGREIAGYDKVHLFGPNNEPRFWEPGDRYAAVRIDGLTVGLVNCNDVRFPEQARALRLDARCEALVVIGWWPWRRDHVWSALMRARAIENGVFVLGCCIAASEYPGEIFAGAGNHVFDPTGDPVSAEDDRFYDLDFRRLDAVLVDPVKTFVDLRVVSLYGDVPETGV